MRMLFLIHGELKHSCGSEGNTPCRTIKEKKWYSMIQAGNTESRFVVADCREMSRCHLSAEDKSKSYMLSKRPESVRWRKEFLKNRF
jgi:hypothetical protein